MIDKVSAREGRRAWLVAGLQLVIATAACDGPAGPAPGGSPTARESSPPVGSPTTSSPGTETPPTPTAGLEAVRVSLREVATLSQPLGMDAHPADGALYVAEKGGRVVRLSAPQGPPVLDLTGEVSTGGEQGLLGLAFSPEGDFLYLNYTDVEGDTRVVEYAFSGGRADPSSRRELLFVDQPFVNHNGGHLLFGPDGFLYIGLGDGGSGGDPMGNGQSLATLLGKMLRIDPRPEGGRPYGIPEDNPFTGALEARSEIWAFGLRNPWRYSFDRATGDLWIGDVGQSAREEVDWQPADSEGAENYGWNRFEGTVAFSGEPAPDAVPPVFEYDHGQGECAVTGGYVYRGSEIPALTGAYLFADYCLGRLMALRAREGKLVEHRELGQTVELLSSFGQDLSGELYVLSLAGPVYRLVPG